ncbi:MAG: hypothetical protein R2939_10460 [Kofleriaceae bacterium]
MLCSRRSRYCDPERDLVAPVLLFLVWAPLILGLPHLVADVRATWCCRGTPRCCGDGAICWWRSCWRPRHGRRSPLVGAAAVAAAVALAPAGRGSEWRRAGVLAAVGALGALTAWRPVIASYVLVHGHNVVAVMLFALVFARGRARRALLLPSAGRRAHPRRRCRSRAGARRPRRRRRLPAAGGGARGVVADHVRPARARVRVPGGGVHYTIWLRLVPELARPQAWSGAVSARRCALLQADVSALVVAGLALLAVGLAAYGAHDVGAARDLYLRLAGFHAYLELAFLGRYLLGARASAPP